MQNSEKCTFCNQNEATQLCDMPRMTIVSHARGKGFERHVLTCDKHLCVKCATHFNGFEFCPDCIGKLKKVMKGN